MTPDPRRIHTLADLAGAFTSLRRRAARDGQVQLSIRDLAKRVDRPSSTLYPYLRGVRICPAPVYEDLLRVLGIPLAELRPWLDAWERVADRGAGSDGTAATESRPVALPYDVLGPFRTAAGDGAIGVVTGRIRRVRGLDIWVNSENTEMRMPRIEEYSISAIIRFEGAIRDEAGRVIADLIADDLERKVAGRRPVTPATVITTTAGELSLRNDVRHVMHVAAVYGQPGEGYRQVADVASCVTNVLAEAERLAASRGARSVLLPLLGTGVAGAPVGPTARTIVNAVVDHFETRTAAGIASVYLLATLAEERDACLRALGTTRLRPD